MVTVQPTLMQALGIQYRDKFGKPTKELALGSGRWNLLNRHCFQPAPGRSWGLVELCRPAKGPHKAPPPPKNKSPSPNGGANLVVLQKFAAVFEGALSNFGLNGFRNVDTNIGTDQKLALASSKVPRNEQDSYTDFTRIKSRLKALQGKGVGFVVVLLPEQDQELYGAVKKLGDQELGLHTICHVCRDHDSDNKNADLRWNSNKAPLEDYWGPHVDLPTMGNLHLKVNLKLSTQQMAAQMSANQAPTSLGSIVTDKTMVVGMDVVCLVLPDYRRYANSVDTSGPDCSQRLPKCCCCCCQCGPKSSTVARKPEQQPPTTPRSQAIQRTHFVPSENVQ